MSEIQKVLFINNIDQQCGVYQFGKNVAKAIQKSQKYNIIYKECSDSKEFNIILKEIKPSCVIYNYHPSTLHWARRNAFWVTIPQVAMIHEVYQQVADAANDFVFDYHIGPDPTLLLKNPIVFKTGRIIPEYSNSFKLPEIPTIGSFGFGTNGKGFEKIIQLVQNEFDNAIIRLNIPFASIGDPNGIIAKKIASECQNIVTKEGIKLQISHDFLDENALLDFIAQNTINVFMYDKNNKRGISSVIEYALAVDRPIAISDSEMFRHLFDAPKSIVLPQTSLKEIISNGLEPLLPFKIEYTKENLVWEYERIIGEVLARGRKRGSISKFWQNGLSKTIFKNRKSKYFSWAINDEGKKVIPSYKTKNKNFIDISTDKSLIFNRILDNEAREIYKPVIEQMWEYSPEILKKKIPEANVQQAFVLDTAVKLSRKFNNPKFLAVGSYEDTAVQILKILGYDVSETDPVVNYDLHTFLTKPSQIGKKFDIIVSTSVIEHVPDDIQFCKDIALSLNPGGVAIITCDYNDQYKVGDLIPKVDCRWYTQKDIKDRIMSSIPDCKLIDEPQWDCPNPDFLLVNKYRYTFASIVFQKQS